MTGLTRILLAAAFVALASTSHAQGGAATPPPAAQPRHPEHIRAVLEVLAEPESIANLASFTKGYYEALLAAGFTQDQAVRIVVGTGVPGLD
ncbi:MAG: hypothetical protein U5S82_24125 [Gammaproteobacteria bacterium]|nr:hypothetical protein [Gammaproteobacteria bacterium]